MLMLDFGVRDSHLTFLLGTVFLFVKKRIKYVNMKEDMITHGHHDFLKLFK